MESHENLIGYLLGALDDREMAEFEQRVKVDPELQRQLRKAAESLRPLQADCGEAQVPAGLAERTCDFVRKASVPLQLELASPAAAWSLTDLVAAVGIFAAAGLLMFPALSGSRERAHVATCQNHLRILGQALARYSDDQFGYYPPIPAEGNLAVAGSYAVSLRDNGLVTTDDLFICPSSPWANVRATFYVPTMEQVKAARGELLRKLQETMGGSFGYSLGYRDSQNQLHSPRDLGHDSNPLMADAPTSGSRGRLVSGNHGASLVNVLYERGNVRTVRIDKFWGLDDLFWNDENRVAAGLHIHDAVIGSSAASP